MQDEPWHVKRRRELVTELEAAAAAKRRKAKPFAIVPLEWAAEAGKATRNPRALVWIRLLYLVRRHRNRTVCLANSWLEKHDVSRFAKARALKELEAAGLIVVERRARKSPRVTVLRYL